MVWIVTKTVLPARKSSSRMLSYIVNFKEPLEATLYLYL